MRKKLLYKIVPSKDDAGRYILYQKSLIFWCYISSYPSQAYAEQSAKDRAEERKRLQEQQKQKPIFISAE